MSVAEAEAFFADGDAKTPAAHKILVNLNDVGLGYLSLGQPLTTLSGGERQRLKLATHMSDKGGVYVLDEPTTGLHLADVEQLLGLRSEEHTSELQSLMRISYAVFCLKKKNYINSNCNTTILSTTIQITQSN